MSRVTDRTIEAVRTLLSGGLVLRRNANTRRWYQQGRGGFTDAQVDVLVKRGVLRFSDVNCDQLELVSDPARSR